MFRPPIEGFCKDRTCPFTPTDNRCKPCDEPIPGETTITIIDLNEEPFSACGNTTCPLMSPNKNPYPNSKYPGPCGSPTCPYGGSEVSLAAGECGGNVCPSEMGNFGFDMNFNNISKQFGTSGCCSPDCTLNQGKAMGYPSKMDFDDLRNSFGFNKLDYLPKAYLPGDGMNYSTKLKANNEEKEGPCGSKICPFVEKKPMKPKECFESISPRVEFLCTKTACPYAPKKVFSLEDFDVCAPITMTCGSVCPYASYLQSSGPCGSPTCPYRTDSKCDPPPCPLLVDSDEEDDDEEPCTSPNCPFAKKKNECDDPECPFAKEYSICQDCGGVVDTNSDQDISSLIAVQGSAIKSSIAVTTENVTATDNKPSLVSSVKRNSSLKDKVFQSISKQMETLKQDKDVEQPKKKKKNIKEELGENYGYPGVQIGHKTCGRICPNIPSYMGWLWSCRPSGSGNPELWRGYKPGAVPRTVHRMIRAHRRALGLFDPSDLPKKKKSKTSTKTRSEDRLKRCVEVKKKNGGYFITVNPVKDPTTVEQHESPYIDCTPMQFSIQKEEKVRKKKPRHENEDCPCDDESESTVSEGSSSDNSELEFNFSPPAALPDLHPRKKKILETIETQYDKKDLPPGCGESVKGKKGKKDKKGKGKKGKKGKK